jgi:beta-mannosidase
MYAGMVQSDILAYSLECFRFGLYCHGGLFWMYNDAWGEVGWTIIDYYMRRKISFYGVKRAFEPVKLIVRERDGLVSITGCNDTGVDISFTARVGYISFDGKIDKTNSVCITIPKRSRVGVLNGVPLPAEDYKRGVFAVMVDDAVAAPADDAAAVVVDNAVTIAIMPDNAAAVSSDDAAAAAVSTIVSPAYLRIVDKRELILPAPDVRIISAEKDGDDAVFELTSSVFVHGVHVKGNVNCSDNYFDLLPGQVKTVRVFDANPGCVVFCSVI